MNTRRKLTLALPIVATILALSLVAASVFVYYPGTIAVQGTAPDVKFALGSNAGKQDLGGNTITVSLTGDTKVDITLHPTNEKTYYKNITVIQNTGSSQYYGWVKVNTPFSDNSITGATLYIRDSSGNAVATVDLKNSGIQPSTPFTIPASGSLYMDVEINIDGGADPTTISDTASLELIYSTQSSESPV